MKNYYYKNIILIIVEIINQQKEVQDNNIDVTKFQS